MAPPWTRARASVVAGAFTDAEGGDLTRYGWPDWGTLANGCGLSPARLRERPDEQRDRNEAGQPLDRERRSQCRPAPASDQEPVLEGRQAMEQMR